jgi:cytochrome c oxidase cbb3-type subunit 2
MSLSWLGLVFGPQLQLGKQTPEQNDKINQLYPQMREGIAHQGAEIYRANGCFYCHSQQVRPQNFGADIQRGWGTRRTVAADYLFDSPVMTGSQRVGPDLSNIGLRQTDSNLLLIHLYNPQSTMPDGKKSNMPSFKFLFEKRKILGAPSANALKFPPNFAPEAGYEIVPTREAEQLVEYLKSLHSEVPPMISEEDKSILLLPSLTPSTNKVESTNAPAGNATNATAANSNAPAASATNTTAK